MMKRIIKYHKSDCIPNQIKFLFISYLGSIILFFNILDPIWTTKIPNYYLQPPIGSIFILNLVTENSLKNLLFIYNTFIFAALLFVRLRSLSFLIIAILSILINWVNYTSGKIDHQILYWSILPLLFALYAFEQKRKSNYVAGSASIILGFFWISSGLAKAYSGYLNFNNYPLRGWLFLYDQDSLLFSIFSNTLSWKLLEISIVLIEILLGLLFILKKDFIAILIALILHLNIEFFMGINFIFMIFFYLFIYLSNRIEKRENYPISLTSKFTAFSVLTVFLIYKDFIRDSLFKVMIWYDNFIFISQFMSLLSLIGIVVFFANSFFLIIKDKHTIANSKDFRLTSKTILIFAIASAQVLFILYKSEPYPLIQGPIFQGNPSFAVKDRLKFHEIVYQKNDGNEQVSGGLNNLMSDFGENVSSEVPLHIRENLIRSIFSCRTDMSHLDSVKVKSMLDCGWHLHRNFSHNSDIQKKVLSEISQSDNACVHGNYTIMDFYFNVLESHQSHKVCLISE